MTLVAAAYLHEMRACLVSLFSISMYMYFSRSLCVSLCVCLLRVSYMSLHESPPSHYMPLSILSLSLSSTMLLPFSLNPTLTWFPETWSSVRLSHVGMCTSVCHCPACSLLFCPSLPHCMDYFQRVMELEKDLHQVQQKCDTLSEVCVSYTSLSLCIVCSCNFPWISAL